jgi:uncharacterized protein
MAETIIGRDAEKKILLDMLTSGDAELVVILGRRRVGKTLLVRNFYERGQIFEYTGFYCSRMTFFSLGYLTA